VYALVATWIISAALAPIEFSEIDPRTIGAGKTPAPIQVKSQLTGESLTSFLSKMVKTFTDFPPLGVVLVALLGVGVAEHTGLINALLKGMLSFTPRWLLTPALLLVSIVSHSAGDTGYVLVVPLGGVIFAAAGRHPVAGIAVAFAGVSGGFSANFLPSALDPLLQGFTQSSAQIIDPNRLVNPLCNWWFTSLSSVLIILIGWYITDRVIEPRLARTPPDADPQDVPSMDSLTARERGGLVAALLALGAGLALLVAAAWPADSPLRREGKLAVSGAPMMESIVPLIFLLFLVPGIVYGYAAGTVKDHRDIVKGMSKSMSTMGYYLVMAFFAAQFTAAFRDSNVGALLAIKGAALLKQLELPGQITIMGIILLTTSVNLLIGSASAKWALLGPIFVPMLMQLGLSPELTQAAYRVGDSSTNIITPLMPYFPLIVVFCQRYLKSTGIGTLISLMIPYSMSFLVCWTGLLLAFWLLGVPLGLQAPYAYP
jgi:aminobenzoyl-glutamate transport protein